VPAGRHVLLLKSMYAAGGSDESVPLTITVEDPPAAGRTIELTEDVVLKGSQDLKWESATVKGNGFRVRSEPGWTGGASITHCRISGLGNIAAAGVEIKTTGGNILVQDSVVESSGVIQLAAEGKGDFLVRNNEFRANNVIKFWSSEPRYSPMIVL